MSNVYIRFKVLIEFSSIIRGKAKVMFASRLSIIAGLAVSASYSPLNKLKTTFSSQALTGPKCLNLPDTVFSSQSPTRSLTSTIDALSSIGQL